MLVFIVTGANTTKIFETKKDVLEFVNGFTGLYMTDIYDIAESVDKDSKLIAGCFFLSETKFWSGFEIRYRQIEIKPVKDTLKEEEKYLAYLQEELSRNMQ